MARILATEIRAGHLIGGRGGAFMQMEMKDVETGTKKNERIRTDEKIEAAEIEPRNMRFLYQDGDSFVFMDTQSYDQLSLPADFLEGQSGYLLPNIDVMISLYNDRPIGVQLPSSVILQVTETEPGLKNSTATGSFKPAKV